MIAVTVKSLDDLPEPYRGCAAEDSKPRDTDMLFLLLAALVFSD